MKKLFTMVLALAAFASSAMALDNEPKEGITFQSFLGFTASKIKGFGYDGKIGGLAGFKAEYVLPNAHGTYINAGLDWIQKGAKLDFEAWPVLGTLPSDGTGKYNLHYLEIPIHVGFHYNFNPTIGVFGEFGPYFAVGVGGKRKLTYDNDGPLYRAAEWDYKAFKKSTVRENFQRWDAGLGFRVGAEYNQHYMLALGCDWGLTDMWRDDWRDSKAVDKDVVKLPEVNNFSFYMTLGYRF